MLAKEYRLSAYQFRKIRKAGASIYGRLFITSFIKSQDNPQNKENPKFGFIIGKYITKKATQRNRVKRRLSETVASFILSQERIRHGNALVCFIARKSILESSYENINLEVNKVLSKIFEL